jgi:7-carboxy-7-deazaguanine synthase
VLYSEIFKSIQGEGHYTGVPTTWLRFFGCNLECNGFGQDDPTDPSTYKLPYQDFDIIEVKNVEDLPVWKYGCDSSYSWSKKFAKIQKNESEEEVAKKLFDQMYNQNTHIAFTGGEPLMKAAQKKTIKILEEMERLCYEKFGKRFTNITWETNGTRPLETLFQNYLMQFKDEVEYFFSVSPKMFNTSGEKDAVCPEIVKEYYDLSDGVGQLKFVCNGSDASWNEIEESIVKFREAGVMYPIWIMPVGATEESQDELAKEITIQTMERGYNVSARVHCYIFGNQIGT